MYGMGGHGPPILELFFLFFIVTHVNFFPDKDKSYSTTTNLGERG